MFCPYCGEKIEDNSSFCSACGKSLKKSHEMTEMSSNNPTYNSEKKSSINRTQVLIFIGAFTFWIFMVFIFLFVRPFSKNIDSQKESSNQQKVTSTDNVPISTDLKSTGLIVNDKDSGQTRFYYVYDDNKNLEYDITISGGDSCTTYTVLHYVYKDGLPHVCQTLLYFDYSSDLELNGIPDEEIYEYTTFNYNANGQLINEVGSNDGEGVEYIYNNKGQLIKEIHNAQMPEAGSRWVTYISYDEDGKKTFEKKTFATGDTYETSFIYDSAGKLIKEGDTVYEYDSEGHMVKRVDGKTVYTYTYISNPKKSQANLDVIKNIVDLNIFESIANEQSSATQSTEWKEAYIDYIIDSQNYYDGFDSPQYVYALVNLNNDSIPELYINFGSTAGGDAICTYYEGQVIEQLLWNYGLSYIEGQNIFRNSGGHMGYYYDEIYSFKNGQFDLLHKGEYELADNSQSYDTNQYYYYWDETPVSSESEYMNLLNAAIDTQQSISPLDDSNYDINTGLYVGDGVYNSYEDIIEAIKIYPQKVFSVSSMAKSTNPTNKENSSSALGGQWIQKGQDWNYLTDDGNTARSTWLWLDGNHDGIAELYHFDVYGTMSKSTTVRLGDNIETITVFIDDNGSATGYTEEFYDNGSIESFDIDPIIIPAYYITVDKGEYIYTLNNDGKQYDFKECKNAFINSIENRGNYYSANVQLDIYCILGAYTLTDFMTCTPYTQAYFSNDCIVNYYEDENISIADFISKEKKFNYMIVDSVNANGFITSCTFFYGG